MNKDSKKIGSITIIGGGIAGIQAALDAANSGFKVYLLEENSTVGGAMAQLDKTFPTNDCSSCMMGPKMVELANHPNIEILTRTSLEGIDGGPGNFTIKIKREPRFIREDRCTACGECARVCPVELPADFDLGLNSRKAVYQHFPQAVPAAFAIDKTGVSPCKQACPAGISVQGYISLIAQGRYQEALQLIKQNNPFPAICGRVCPHPCEEACNRRQLDEPVATEYLHRFVADLDLNAESPYLPAKKESKNRKVAVVGAGPGGLSAAYYLAVEGHEVCVFEAMPEPGGWMRYGIPEYRLPRDILQAEIEIIRKLGVEIRTGVSLGQDFSIGSLRQDGYAAIFLAVGTQNGRPLNVPGENLKNVYSGGDFLKAVNSGQGLTLGTRVAVIGGGNVAMDAARTALRFGAQEVHVLYRRSRKEMPANEEEVAEAQEEGIHFHFLTVPVELLPNDDGRVGQIRCQRMKLGELDPSGRPRPVPIPDSEYEMPIDCVINAIDLTNDLSFLDQDHEDNKPAVTRQGTLVADPVTLATSIPGIFAGGDTVTGPATVVEAVRAGHEAAVSIDRFLRGEDLAAGRKRDRRPAEIPAGPHASLQRTKMPRLAPDVRRRSFDEVQTGFTEAQAREEAKRCLQCGLCSECYRCVEVCTAQAVDHEMEQRYEELQTGAVIVSAGFQPFDARLKPEYGYGLWPNVMTTLEYERMLSAAGPFSGRIQRLSDGKKVHRMAWILCVGSRDVGIDRNYCSSVCCMSATKQAMITKEHDPQVEAKIFFIDLRAQGKGFDRFYERAESESGVRYVRSMVSRVVPIPETDRLQVTYSHDEHRIQMEEFDLVVLSVGLCAHQSAVNLAERIGLELNPYGYCATHPLDSAATSRPGIFVAGVFQGPKDIPETVQQGSSAAAGATALLSDVRGSRISRVVQRPERSVNGEAPRIGVLVCHCGTNIAGVVDVDRIVDYVMSLPNVIYAANAMFACSTDQQREIKRLINEHHLNRLVVASCTPRTHEPLFRNTLREAGLNPYLFELANIREHDSWVHRNEPEAATQKALDLVRMSVARARLLQPLTETHYPVVQRALVIGGGLAGLTAALTIAEQGYESVLIEKTPELGGNARTLYYTEDGADPAQYVQDLIHKIKTEPLITVYANAEVVETHGVCGHLTTTILKEDEAKEIVHGVTIVAVGGQEYQPEEYLYGKDHRVMTRKEFESLLVLKPEKAKQYLRIVMIQCVGSREPDHLYCSRVCCTGAVKNSLKLKSLNPDAQVSILYRDMRTFGFRESYYHQARLQGVRFFPYVRDQKPEVTLENDGLQVKVFDQQLRLPVQLKADLLVLNTAIRPNPKEKELAEILRLPLDQDGFFMEAHPKLRPLDFIKPGHYLCGLAQGPKFAAEAITQARGAAARAMTILSKEMMTTEGMVAQVDTDLCRGCYECEKACLFEAIRVEQDEDGRKAAVVNKSLCTGCGACNVACPTGAASPAHFQDDQIDGMIRAFRERVS
ncbi:MAG: NAD(P)-binding protein [Thermodesulfobacteriota bacterium]